MASKTTFQPYTTPFRATVVAMGPPKEFVNNNGEKKTMIVLGLANSEKAVRASLYNSNVWTFIKEGSSIAVKNYITKPDGSLIFNQTTSIFLSQPLDVPSKLREEAYNIVHPPEAELMAISKATTSPVKTAVSLKGFITQDESPRAVNVAGRTTHVRGLTLEDPTATIKLSLWREQSEMPLKIGDYILATNLSITKYNNAATAGTTSRTVIQVLDPPSDVTELTIDGVTPDGDQLRLLIQNAEHTFTIESTILTQYLKIDSEDFLSQILTRLPIKIKAKVTGKSVMAIL